MIKMEEKNYWFQEKKMREICEMTHIPSYVRHVNWTLNWCYFDSVSLKNQNGKYAIKERNKDHESNNETSGQNMKHATL